ncbi:hypothetical protein DFS21_11046 [Pseudomonas sp. 2848]|uniref:pyocin knob domain-containing protein n=1 Tax=Pseudomonas sp. 2848 TaxID=2183926 RepID=UPI000DACE67D|nr:pyocin knob domain-containing protein [Pseudomonas sp. 2848]PZW76594.1 hypothetical protein DFS21_11046 [Pseudomonas sp. 2848]
MAQKTIELGTAPDGMDGDDARTAFQKTNDNFTELYQGVGGAQPESPKLSAIAASVWAANQLLIATGENTIGGLASGTAGRAVIAAETAAQGRSALALGVAATFDVTTSATDQTANRLLKKGDFGLGGVVPSEPDGTWLGTRFKQWAGSAPDRPPTAQIAVGFDSGYANNRRAQFAISLGDASAKAYFRGITATAETAGLWRGLVAEGDFGIGGYGALVLSTAINSLVTTGFYYCNSANSGENLPVASNGYLLVHAQGSLYTKQTFSHVTDGRTWERFLVNNVWQNWDPVLKGSNVTVSAGDIGVGRLLKNGDWGIGATNNAVTVADLNVVAGGGIRRVTPDTTNRPSGLNYGTVVDTMYEKSSENWAQMAMSMTEPRAWIRSRINNAAPAVSEIYTRFNAVGTVSFSGGNTGAIIERGSGVQGQWIRYADGTLECWGMGTFACPLSTDPVPATIAVPQPFNFVDNTFVGMAWAQPHITWTGFGGVLACAPGTTSYFSAAIRNTSSAQNVNIGWRAIGRWRNA